MKNTAINTDRANGLPSTSEHAPIPWAIREAARYPAAIVSGNSLITEFHQWSDSERAYANFIVRCVNAHGFLTRALRTISVQSIAGDWTAEQALGFVVRHARVELARLASSQELMAEYFSCHFAGGATAYCEGIVRNLPTYFTTPQCENAVAWLAGWDYARSVDALPPQQGDQAIPATANWCVGIGGTSYYPLAVYSGDIEVAAFHAWDIRKDANANFIVRAAKAHSQLIASLRETASIEISSVEDSASAYSAVRERTRSALINIQ